MARFSAALAAAAVLLLLCSPFDALADVPDWWDQGSPNDFPIPGVTMSTTSTSSGFMASTSSSGFFTSSTGTTGGTTGTTQHEDRQIDTTTSSSTTGAHHDVDSGTDPSVRPVLMGVSAALFVVYLFR